MRESPLAAEIAALSHRFGAPVTHRVTLRPERLFDPLGKTDRVGEVCMVVRRPSGRLITARKTFYPRSAHRLLTGGIARGESILDALLRETAEETGLDVDVRRFLAAITYTLDDSPASRSFQTFAFLLDETGGTLQCADPHERLEAFHEVAVDELPRIAAQLDSLDAGFDAEINGRWRDWGRFRAVAHRVVYESLRHDAGGAR
jgi:8-oxo-dGTP pyrophosphatase MutT (NUDIX family)